MENNNCGIKDTGLKKIYLFPGEIFFGSKRVYIKTLLGSCVSAVFYNHNSETSAICHGILPAKDVYEKKKEVKESNTNNLFRFVDYSMYYIIKKFKELGIDKADIEVKLYGGSTIIDTSVNGREDFIKVGEQNIHMALKVIEEEKLNLVYSDVGGNIGRILILETKSGKVSVKYMHKNHVN